MIENLIIDVGMHLGKDTEFYLRKGFHVVGIEANPFLVEQVQTQLSQYLNNNSLTICNLAIAEYEGEIEFYINDKHDDWGTISETFAARNEKMGTANSIIRVRCIPFESILQQYGIPYYLKIDIEGADTLCLQALLNSKERPKYLSIEGDLTTFEGAFTELSLLWNLGYRHFKIVNQALNDKVRCPNPPLEGEFVDCQFDGTSSGPFGEEAPGKWMTIQETLAKYQRILLEQKYFGGTGKFYNTIFHRLYERVKREPVGWYDFHAKLGV